MTNYRPALHIFRIIADSLIIAAVFYLADYFTGRYSSTDQLPGIKETVMLLLLLVTWFFSSNATKLYDEFRSRNFSYELVIVMKNVGVQLIASIVLIFVIKEISYSRIFVFYNTLFLTLFLLIEKYALYKVLIKLRSKGRNLRTILIVGAGELGKKFYNTINKNKHFGYRVLGFLDDAIIPELNGVYLGKIDRLQEVLKTNQVDNVMVALPDYASEKIEDVLQVCGIHSTRVKLIPDYFRFSTPKYSATMFAQYPVISVREEKINEIHWRFWKRGMDIVISGLVILIVFPWLLPLLGIIIKIDSKGPVFFKQIRWGRDNKRFTAYKLRSMVCTSTDTDENGKYVQASISDPRVTRAGKIMRKLNIDELPQFINVLKGDMSVVGPRPHPEPLNLESNKKIPYYMMRHFVKPGLTGWAQVNGYRGETKEPDAMKKRVEYDLWYIENWSIWLDVQIMFLTIWIMLKGNPNAY